MSRVGANISVHPPKISPWLLGTLGLALLMVCSFLLFFELGDAPVFGDETLYIRVAGRTLQTGRWFPIVGHPHPFIEKPPLTVWGAAAGMRVAGVHEFGARWVNGLVGVLLCALTAWFALRLGNVWTMAIAPLLLITSPGLLLDHGLRSVVPESWLLLSVTAAFFWFSVSQAKSPTFRLGGLALLSIFAGGTKGIVGPIVIGSALGLVELIAPAEPLSAGRRLRRAVVTGAAAAIPGILAYCGWLLFSLATLSGVRDFLHRDLVVRASGGRAAIDMQPFSIYLRAIWKDFGLLAVAGPMTLLACRWRVHLRPGAEPSPGRRESWTLLLWIAAVLAVFGIPKARLPWYCFPAFPALAIAAALALDRLRSLLADRRNGTWRLPATTVFALSLALLFAVRADALRRAWPVWDPHSLLALQRILDADSAAKAYTETGLDQGEYGRTHVVEWQRFYVRRFTELAQRKLPPDAPACTFVVTPEPDAWRNELGTRVAGVTPVAGSVPGWLTLHVLDLCGGRFAGRP